MILEQFVRELNSLAFFKEFTFSRNTFKPSGGGTELELADNIIWLDEDLTILQLKERAAVDGGDEASETNWFTNKVLKNGTKQIRDTLGFLGANPIIGVSNDLGHHFEIKGAQIKSITKIIVFLPGKVVPKIARDTKFRMSQTAGFIHLLSAKDYLNICRTLRVPADIRDYFEYRQRLLEKVNNLEIGEQFIVGQYLSGDENTTPSENSLKYLVALKQDFPSFDLSPFLSSIGDKIEHQVNPSDYYEILRQFARLPRSGWKEAKTRLIYCIDALNTQKFRSPTRFSWSELSVGFVFIPMDPKLMLEKNWPELMRNGLINFTALHKYEQKLDSCVGVVMVKDGEEFLLNWCIMKHPWASDVNLDKKLKDGSPFLEVKENLIPRYSFQ